MLSSFLSSAPAPAPASPFCWDDSEIDAAREGDLDGEADLEGEVGPWYNDFIELGRGIISRLEGEGRVWVCCMDGEGP